MKVKLVVKGGARKKTLEIRLPTVIGRSRDASLKVNNTQVSRKHCEIFEKDDELWVRDLGSANGTFVNQERIRGKALLANGDLLNVGPIAMRAQVETTGSVLVPDVEASDGSEIRFDDVETATSGRDEAGLSDLDYKETSDGSFIGIVDELPTEPMGQSEEDDTHAGELPESLAEDDRTDAAEVLIDGAGDTGGDAIKGGDSALNDFFKGLD